MVRTRTCGDDHPDDCDERNTELPTYGYEDRDGDNHGDPARKALGCRAPSAGAWSLEADCDDSNGNINPDKVEGNEPTDAACTDLQDNDCDGKVDLADPGCTP